MSYGYHCTASAGSFKSCIGYICCSRSSGFLSGKWKNLQGEGRKADAAADDEYNSAELVCDSLDEAIDGVNEAIDLIEEILDED